jgi:hypothetical protein
MGRAKLVSASLHPSYCELVVHITVPLPASETTERDYTYGICHDPAVKHDHTRSFYLLKTIQNTKFVFPETSNSDFKLFTRKAASPASFFFLFTRALYCHGIPGELGHLQWDYAIFFSLFVLVHTDRRIDCARRDLSGQTVHAQYILDANLAQLYSELTGQRVRWVGAWQPYRPCN